MKEDVLLGFGDAQALADFLDSAKDNNISVLDSDKVLGLARVFHFSLRGSSQAGLLPCLTTLRSSPTSPFRSSPSNPWGKWSTQEFRTGIPRMAGCPEDNTNWGKRQTLAILDTGVWTDHEAFINAKITQIDLLSPEQSVPGDYDGHGTAVASLIVADSPTLKGIAPATELLSIRVLDGQGKGDTFTVAKELWPP